MDLEGTSRSKEVWVLKEYVNWTGIQTERKNIQEKGNGQSIWHSRGLIWPVGRERGKINEGGAGQ